ncbi:MAG: ParB-like protein [Limisphaerales bacterium]
MTSCGPLAAALLILVWGTPLAGAGDVVPYNPALPAKSLCQVGIERLRPTQFAVGYREVDDRAKEIARKSPKKLKAYVEEHLPLIVIGPDDQPYLIDGHHLARALLKARINSVEVRVEANWRHLSPAEFWNQMKEHGWVYLYDNRGQGPLEVEKLPKTVTEMADDPYRALAWAVRKRGGLHKTNGSFDEFKWANFFRSRVPIGSQPGDFDRAVKAALKISHSPEAKDLPGYER